MGERKNNNKRSPQLGNQSSVSYQGEEDGREEEDGKQRGKEERTIAIFVIFHGDLTWVSKQKLNKNVDLKDIYDFCTDIVGLSTSNNVSAIM